MRPARVLPCATFLAGVLVLATPMPGLVGQAEGRRPTTGPPGADTITEAQLRAYLSFVASDLLEGRETPSRGLDVTAAFLASHAARLGLRPAGGDGTYLQRIPLTRRTLDPERTTLAVDGRALRLGDDFLVGEVHGAVEGGVVYVGNGTVLRARGLDPFQNVDVRGKFVVTHRGLPTGIAPPDLQGTRGTDWEATEEAARARGAIGLLYLPDFEALQQWSTRDEQRRTRDHLSVDTFPEKAQAGLPSATLDAEAVAVLFGGETVGPQEIFQRALRREPAAPFALSSSRSVRLAVVAREHRSSTANVVAVLEGRDEALATEYVAVGAHYDHLGLARTPGVDGDRIHNGADDDGSGTVALLTMAEAFVRTRPRPKRSVLFVWHTGEEVGLWGSRFFTEQPTVPLDRIVAHVNVDMIGRGRAATSPASGGPLALTDSDSVYVVGSRRLSPRLGDTLARANDRYHRLRFDYALDAPDNPARIYERSDHYNYAQRGIPVAFFFTGLHEDYHGVNDEVDGIDFTKLRRVVQTIYAGVRAVAEDPAFSRR